MNRPTVAQVQEWAETLALALISVFAYVMVTNPHAAVAPWLVALIVPLLGVSLTATTVQARRRDHANQAAAGKVDA